ncbi:MAG: tRNA guanosine(34) transglycosylase Tgt [Candidatus Lokiarchaeota archaeon]|nr:tRNA guanosine(34) transglycosylase Tgt [Candidatus Lokiarchaeota archaeon]
MYEFNVSCMDNNARLGTMKTKHGTVETPAFINVGTKATVRGMMIKDLEEIGTQILIVNAFHLFLKPGVEPIKKGGGLHKYMGNWKRPIITDSGGFQVMSKQFFKKITEDGIYFKSPYYWPDQRHKSGIHLLTPEIATQVQHDLNADIIMCFDECPPYSKKKGHDYMEQSLERTLKWAKRCKNYHIEKKSEQALFGIIQGGSYLDLRKLSLRKTLEIDFPGYAFGGLSVGEPREVRNEILKECVPLLPTDKIRYLMGVGTPEDIFEGVEHGIDLFDSVYPTKNARHGSAFTSDGEITIDTVNNFESLETIDPECDCYVCKNYSKSIISHLHKDPGQLIGRKLIIYHNLYFLNKLMVNIRKAIKNAEYREFKENFFKRYNK